MKDDHVTSARSISETALQTDCFWSRDLSAFLIFDFRHLSENTALLGFINNDEPRAIRLAARCRLPFVQSRMMVAYATMNMCTEFKLRPGSRPVVRTYSWCSMHQHNCACY